ncbi:MAG: glycosyltransferase family 4 protein [Kiritimatiellae bacterium]|nr:glycosyltransferase family 4 protein [Kiritimatiellia bacterium]MDW8457775.1 glycosyltransferase family 4 protein [Verrucomicrobiota bacterium]
MTEARRLAFLAPRYSEKGTIGGAETLLRALAERCARAGRSVDLLTTCASDHFTWKNDRPAGVKTVNGVTIHFFPVNEDRDVATFLRIQAAIDKGVPLSPEEERLWITNSVNSRALMDHLAAHASGYDRIVAGPYLFGITWSAVMRYADKAILVPCLHDEPFAYLGIMKKMFLAARGIMFNSAPERALAARLYGIDLAKTSVVGMGLDPFDSDPRATAETLGIRAPYAMYSGRREPLKGTPLLCEYLNVFRERTGINLHLVLTGSGPIDAPESLRPVIHDLGFVSEKEKHDAMAGAAVFIHPSVNESFGIVLLEAWLAGTPALVHARSEVLRDHVRRSNGGLWFKHYAHFEEALSRLLADEPLRRALGEAGRAYVLREYSWAAVERRLFEALDRP